MIKFGLVKIGFFAFSVLFLVSAFSINVLAQNTDNTEAIEAKEAELRAVQEKIDALNTARKKHEADKNYLEKSIDIINDNIATTKLELDKTAISIDYSRELMRKNVQDLQTTQTKVDRLRSELQDVLREMCVLDKGSLWQTFFTTGTFAEFMQKSGTVRSLQQKMMGIIYVAQDARKVLEKQQNELQQKEDDLAQLRGLQEAQKEALNNAEIQKQDALVKTVAAQKKVTGLIAEAEQARKEIQQKIFSLRNAGINMSLTDAVKIAQYAGKVTGVRPALLLGVLKIESNLGTSVGSGRYPDDIHPLHRDAFLRVVKKLGLDFTQAPVSAKPKNYPGWGGAMGPGQIMPGIWESIEGTVAELTGKAIPSPYNLQDAFVATAIILRNSGAASGNEYEAVNRYFAGGNWQRFTWYGDRVLAVAKEYESTF